MHVSAASSSAFAPIPPPTIPSALLTNADPTVTAVVAFMEQLLHNQQINFHTALDQQRKDYERLLGLKRRRSESPSPSGPAIPVQIDEPLSVKMDELPRKQQPPPQIPKVVQYKINAAYNDVDGKISKFQETIQRIGKLERLKDAHASCTVPKGEKPYSAKSVSESLP